MSQTRNDLPATSNLHVVQLVPLVSPRTIKNELPVSRSIAEGVVAARDAVREIITGRDPRLLAIVGPCSIHDPTAAFEYAQRLARLHEEVVGDIYLLMRVYFEKPRTTIGWKGLINDPHLDGSRDMEAGLRLARRILLEVNGLGLPAATELVGPVIPQYVADLIAWTAIGARTAESQTHREMASGLSMPVGFKNTTEGNLQVALDAMVTAATPHSFLGIDEDGRAAIVQTTGNPDRHLVLRGGGGKTNYDADAVARAEELLRKAEQNPHVLVDCSHGNSNKDHTRQILVLRDVLDQVRSGQRTIMGVMLESHLHAGSQKLGDDPKALRYGVSITDSCLDWESTEAAIREAARELRAVRLPAKSAAR